MPNGFTKHYFFEFTNGWVFYRHLLDASFAIPVQFRSYFPDVSELKVDDDEVANEPEVLKPKKRKRKQKIAPGSQAPKKKRKGPGRPKKLQAPIPASYRFFVKREKKSDN